MATLTQHQINSNKLSADVERFLAAGGEIKKGPDPMTLQQALDANNARRDIAKPGKAYHSRKIRERYAKVGSLS